jgi:basic membrane lipoprotein Med (substrate-binding protein (PBP1-ABC) superfamily)
MSRFTLRRRVRATLLCAAVLVVPACASDTEPGGDTGEAPRMAMIYYPQYEDGSWGEAALTGAQALLDEGVISDLATQENVQPGADAISALEDYAEQGYSPIIAHSFNYGDDVKTVAAEYPDTLFVYAGGFGDNAGNVGDYAQPFHEVSYLEGILAAGATADGSVAGAAGFDIPVCRGMYNAFLDGAREVRPGTTGNFVAVGDWTDVPLAKETALSQADSGATMFIGCGQGPTFGQIEAADERSLTAFGYVGDMAGRSDAVVASFTWNLAEVFRPMVADVAAGRADQAGYYEVGMADGGMSVVISPSWRDQIDPDAMATFEERQAAITDGSFTVPFSDQ